MLGKKIIVAFFFILGSFAFSQTPQGNIDYAMEYFPPAGGVIMHGGW